MTQALPKIVSFEDFITWYPENSGIRYELHNGEIVEMSQPVESIVNPIRDQVHHWKFCAIWQF